MKKGIMGRMKSFTKILLFFSLILMLIPGIYSIPEQELCTNGDVVCGHIFEIDGREFICDQFRNLKDAEQFKGDVVVCNNGAEYVAAPESNPEDDGKVWVFCGQDVPNKKIDFEALVNRVNFELTAPDLLVHPQSSDDPDLSVEVEKNPDESLTNQVVTGVAIRWGLREIEALGIFVKELGSDGVLGPEIEIFKGNANSVSDFDFVIKGDNANDVVTGIALSFDGIFPGFSDKNMMELSFREFQPETKQLSDTVTKKRGKSPITRVKEMELSFPNRKSVMIGLGVKTWDASFGNLVPEPGIPERDLLGLEVSFRNIKPVEELVVLRNIDQVLTDEFQFTGETFNTNPPDRFYFIEPVKGKGQVELSFKQDELLTVTQNPNGQIFARTPVLKSNAKHAFTKGGERITLTQPLGINDAAEQLRRYVCFTFNKKDYDIRYCPDVTQGSSTDLSVFKSKRGDSFFGDASFGKGLLDGRYYCLRDGLWDQDLDTIDVLHDDKTGEACKFARDLGPGTQSLLYLWTGSKCCGDDEDENYNDDGEKSGDDSILTSRKGACFNGFGEQHLNFLETESAQSKDVLVFNGTFQGCKIDATNFNLGNEGLLTILDDEGEQLINNAEYCTVVEDNQKSFFCSFQEEWTDVGVEDVMELRKIRWSFDDTFKSEKECCTPNNCWDGNGCVTHGTVRNIEDNPPYFCFHGDWKTKDENIFKFSPKRNLKSLDCEEDECFLGSGGNDCVEDTFFDGDDYCSQGNWTTRTRLIAEEMLKVADNKFTLYCDTFDKVFNYFTYNYLESKDFPFTTQDGTVATKFLGANSVPSECDDKSTKMLNNICVLNNEDNAKVLFGVSYNCPVTAPTNNVLKLFGKDASHCENVLPDEEEFELCTRDKPGIHETGFAYYNPKINSILFSPTLDPGFKLQESIQDCSVTGAFSFLDFFNSNNFICMSKLLINTFTDPRQEENLRNLISNVEKIKGFNKIYFSGLDNKKSVFATMELGLVDEVRGPLNYLALYYDGFFFNICSLVKSIVGADTGEYSCIKKENTFEIISASSQLGKLFEDEVWNQLTAKTRIQDITPDRCYEDGCNGNIPTLCKTAAQGVPPDPDFGSATNDCCGQGQTVSHDTDCANNKLGERFNCEDGLDNDGDTAKDACDSDCGIVKQNVNVKSANGEDTCISQNNNCCTDGIDNDCDGKIDFGDVDCQPLVLNPKGPTLIKGADIVFTATLQAGGSPNGPFNWLILNDNTDTSTKECVFSDLSVDTTTSSNSVSVRGNVVGECKLKVTDGRGIDVISSAIKVISPKISCSLVSGNCDSGAVSIGEVSKNLDGLSALPNSNTFSNNICCSLSNGVSLTVSTSSLPLGDELYKISNNKLSVIPVSGATQKLFISSPNEKIKCEAFKEPFFDSLDDSSLSETPLEVGSNCKSLGFDACVLSLDKPDSGLITECDGKGDGPIKLCCGIEGAGQGVPANCVDGETRCNPITFRSVQVCNNGKFFDSTFCNSVCLGGICLLG